MQTMRAVPASLAVRTPGALLFLPIPATSAPASCFSGEFQKISITKWSSVGAVNGVDLECLAQIKIELGIRLDVPGPRVELHA
jgi:hypothetical protein